MPCVILFRGNAHDEHVMSAFTSRLDALQAANKIADALNSRLDKGYEADVVGRDTEIGIWAICVYKQIELKVPLRDKGSVGYLCDYGYVADFTLENVCWAFRQSQNYVKPDPAIRDSKVLTDEGVDPTEGEGGDGSQSEKPVG